MGANSYVEEGVKAVEAVHEKKLELFDAHGAPCQEQPREEVVEHHLEKIACAAHMANRAYCIGTGDKSQPTWEEAPDWQKASAIAGVRKKLLDPLTTPEQSHESWLAQKAADGWTYGPVKDPDKKEHPCFKPYADLDEASKMKDFIFIDTIVSMGKSLGLL